MGSQVGTKDCVGWTVLHHVAASGDEIEVSFLPLSPADRNLQTGSVLRWLLVPFDRNVFKYAFS